MSASAPGGIGLRRALSAGLVLVLAAAAACAGSDGTRDRIPTLHAERALSGRSFDHPVEIGAYPGDRLFVAQQDGRVLLTDTRGGEHGALLDLRPHVGLDPGEGLLSAALDPGFDENGALWAYYFAAEPPRTVLSRFSVDRARERAPLESELVVLELSQPGFNQNGGAVRFGPDGMLYLSVGDGSASLDPFDQGQDVGTLLATVLRIDVRAASAAHPYAIPPDNPFTTVAGARGELWAYGLRNPWRMAIDPATGALWLGDVGASTSEQIERIERGGNHGWSVFEGSACLARPAACAELANAVPPVAEYAHADGRCAAIGGLVYRGEALAGLDGTYLYADLCSGEVFALDADDPGEPVVVARGEWSAVSFGTGADGALYLVDYDGPIWRLTP